MKNPFRKPKTVKESTIEKYLVQQVERAGGICRKTVSPGHNGFPDRLVLGRGFLCFVELKQAKGIVSALQDREHEILQSFGWPVAVIRSKAEVDTFIENMKIGRFLNAA